MLAVNVDYQKKLATIGTERDQPVPRDKILESLKVIGYVGKFAE